MGTSDIPKNTPVAYRCNTQDKQETLQASIQSEIKPADDYEYITINNFNTRTDMNTAQMNIDPETGEEYVGIVTNWGNAI